jgi:hypothetical protein
MPPMFAWFQGTAGAFEARDLTVITLTTDGSRIRELTACRHPFPATTR